MTDLTERLRALSRHEHDDLSIGGEAADEIEWLRQWKVAYELCRRDLTAERDALRARIEGAVKVENFRRYSYGHEYLDISGTDETEVTDGNLYGKRVALVVIE